MTKHLDEDGYPTDEALKLIEEWDLKDFEGLMNFIKGIWWSADWGFGVVEIGEELHHNDNLATKRTYYLSTGGWSGNEDIIHAFQKNWAMWHMVWYESRRGGHYIFEAPNVSFKDQNSMVFET